MATRILSWEDRPDRKSAAAGLGCAALLLVFACAGAAAAVEQGSYGSLVGLPLVVLFAVAAVVLGLGHSRVEVDAGSAEVRRSNRILGRTLRRTTVPLGQAEAVTVQALEVGGRTLHRVQVHGEHRVDVTASPDAAEAAQRAADLAALLGLPLR